MDTNVNMWARLRLASRKTARERGWSPEFCKITQISHALTRDFTNRVRVKRDTVRGAFLNYASSIDRPPRSGLISLCATTQRLHLLLHSTAYAVDKVQPRQLADSTNTLRTVAPTALEAAPGPPVNEKLSCRGGPGGVALGFLYTYACLVASESDFFVANQKRLLPRYVDDAPIAWPRQDPSAVPVRQAPSRPHQRHLLFFPPVTL